MALVVPNDTECEECFSGLDNSWNHAHIINHLPSSNDPYKSAPVHTQQQPPSSRRPSDQRPAPKLTTTLWEDEGTLCFQVEDSGICVARREDNNFINGTKLLNVANITRGRRDGMLKSEKVRQTVKIGPKHLKGVWIPFERAIEFASKEKITDRLYPLFEPDIKSIFGQPTTELQTKRLQRQPKIFVQSPPQQPIATTSASELMEDELDSAFIERNSSFDDLFQSIGMQFGQFPDNNAPLTSRAASEIGSSPSMSDLTCSDYADDERNPDIVRMALVTSRFLWFTYLQLTATTLQVRFNQRGHDNSPANQPPTNLKPPSGACSDSQKRKRNPADNKDYGAEKQPNLKRSERKAKRSTSAGVPLFACPFHKYDNHLFGPDSLEEAYRGCAGSSFVNIAHLKQHLRRTHFYPVFFCFRCCRSDFSSQAMFVSHIRSDSPCLKLEPPRCQERIGSDLINELRLDRANPAGTDPFQYWHRVYDAFFPGAASIRPVTPYYEGPAAEHCRRFAEFSASVLDEVLPVVQRRLGLDDSVLQIDQSRLQQDILQETTQLYLQYLSTICMPHVGKASQTAPGPALRDGSQRPMSPPPQAASPTEAPSSMTSASDQSLSTSYQTLTLGQPNTQNTQRDDNVGTLPSSDSLDILEDVPVIDPSIEIDWDAWFTTYEDSDPDALFTKDPNTISLAFS